jgi:hypothetical protein
MAMLRLDPISAGTWRYHVAGRAGDPGMPQTEEQKIRARLRSYERKLRKEKEKYGFY